MRFSLLLAILFVASSALPVQFGNAEDWPQFLGTSRNGISEQKNLISSLDEPSFRVKWTADVGVGMSAVSVSAGSAVTLSNDGTNQVIVCFNTDDGTLLWKTTIGESYENPMGNGPRATAAMTKAGVFAYTGDGRLVSVNRDSGQLNWVVDTIKAAGSKVSDYGMSSSPLIVGNKVIVHVGGRGSAVCAYHIESGKLIWKSGTGAAGYSSALSLKANGLNQVLSLTAAGLYALNESNGDVLCHYPYKTPYDCNTASPMMCGEGIFISAGENHGCAMLEINRMGNDFEFIERWTSNHTKSVMRNEWQTSIHFDDCIIGFDNVGSAGPVTHLTCVDTETGETKWQVPRFGKGNLTLADEKLWITTMAGELILARADSKGFQELGRKPLFNKTRQSLSIANGHGYLRDNSKIYCLDLRKQ
ncbi:PQQ-binding-like beta-propeller repeat protein [bacterium]|nr:PQQ-binding-like beta-propeller repeat protein [bacterium]